MIILILSHLFQLWRYRGKRKVFGSGKKRRTLRRNRIKLQKFRIEIQKWDDIIWRFQINKLAMLIKKKKLKCRSGNLMFEGKKKKMELRETDVRRFGKKEDQNNVLFHISAVFFLETEVSKKEYKIKWQQKKEKESFCCSYCFWTDFKLSKKNGCWNTTFVKAWWLPVLVYVFAHNDYIRIHYRKNFKWKKNKREEGNSYVFLYFFWFFIFDSTHKYNSYNRRTADIYEK